MTAAVLERPDARQRREVKINLRAPAQVRDLIDRAAKAIGKTRSEFMLESARTHAEDVLLDQRLFNLEDKAYQEFLHKLDNPPRPSKELRELMASKAPWEK